MAACSARRRRCEVELGTHKNLSVADISRLMALVGEISDREHCSPSEAIDLISRLVTPATRLPRLQRPVLANFITRLRKLRMLRNEIVGAPLFRDPAWDMLLELFVAHEREEEITITSLCYASGVPLSTGTRQFQRLEEHGLVSREGDREDTRRCIARPTAKALRSVAKIADLYLEETASLAATAVAPVETAAAPDPEQSSVRNDRSAA